MTDFKDNLENAKDKVVGELKEGAGKVTDNEQLELEGKMQSAKADVKQKGEEIKEGIAGKINDTLDKH